jgi:hypothetical protein
MSTTAPAFGYRTETALVIFAALMSFPIVGQIGALIYLARRIFLEGPSFNAVMKNLGWMLLGGVLYMGLFGWFWSNTYPGERAWAWVWCAPFVWVWLRFVLMPKFDVVERM